MSDRDVTSATQNTNITTDPMFKRHAERLRTSLNAHSHDTICDFILNNTYIRGKRFSFEGHEYQRKILEDKSASKVILKSAQIGISEMSARMALAYAALVDGFTTIYTLPAASTAQTFMKTRIDPVIDSSPYLRELVSGDVDNSSVKRLGSSYIYLKGAQVDRQAISVPADAVIMDEVDNSSQDVLTLFESRLIHSMYKITIKLSTPTIPNYGIDLAYRQSRRNMNFVKCCHCNEWFYPEYYEHVRIPNFKQPLDTIRKPHFADRDFKWKDAYVGCPKCGKPVDLSPKYRDWVVENPDDAFVAAGFRVSPFDCPSVITISDLVKSSVDYARRRDFDNQRLGIASEDSDASLGSEELDRLITHNHPRDAYGYVMGLDMGMTCWATIAAVLPDNQLVIVHTEGIPLMMLQERRRELARIFNLRLTVVDNQPYTETVFQMQREDKNMFAAIYLTRAQTSELYKVKEQDEDMEKGRQWIRQVSVSRDPMFDVIMGELRSGAIRKVSDKNDQLWKEHLTDMKRVPQIEGTQFVYRWVKTLGNDHLHHSLLYARIAANLMGASIGNMSGMSPILGKISTSSMFALPGRKEELDRQASWAQEDAARWLRRR